MAFPSILSGALRTRDLAVPSRERAPVRPRHSFPFASMMTAEGPEIRAWIPRVGATGTMVMAGIHPAGIGEQGAVMSLESRRICHPADAGEDAAATRKSVAAARANPPRLLRLGRSRRGRRFTRDHHLLLH